MSHRSRVCAILFDVDESAFRGAAVFWSRALGPSLNFDPDRRYSLMPGQLDYTVQRVEPGREGVHIDIETDNVDAEVVRLENLGAIKREKVKGWWVMVAPGGLPFCVVPVQSQTWPKGAIEWD